MSDNRPDEFFNELNRRREARPTKQEWKGELPPVGAECEYLPDPKIKTDWRRCTFIAHVNGEFFVVTDSDDKAVDRMSDLIPASRRFRPLKSPQERQRDELAHRDNETERLRARVTELEAKAMQVGFDYSQAHILRKQAEAVEDFLEWANDYCDGWAQDDLGRTYWHDAQIKGFAKQLRQLADDTQKEDSGDAG